MTSQTHLEAETTLAEVTMPVVGMTQAGKPTRSVAETTQVGTQGTPVEMQAAMPAETQVAKLVEMPVARQTHSLEVTMPAEEMREQKVVTKPPGNLLLQTQ